MKNFYYQLLQQLNAKKSEKGFNLIELLVVIIIIGILSAIALPAFLNQAAKARQSEAKQTLGALNRGQQAYRLENPQFAPTIALLALGVDTDTENYLYGDSADGVTVPAASAASFGGGSVADNFPSFAIVTAAAKDPVSTRHYSGGVGASADPAGNATTVTILCESVKPGDDNKALASYTEATGGTVASVGCTDGNALN